MSLLQMMLWAIGLALEVRVIWLMVRVRAWLTLPMVFLYSLALLISTVVEVCVTAARRMGYSLGHTTAYYFWVDEAVLQVLIFVAVVSLVAQATVGLPNSVTMQRAVIAGAVLFAPVSLGLHYSQDIQRGVWMTLVARDLNFCTALLDLALWMVLIAFHRENHRLLLLSGGLGIQFSGEAIGHALRSMLSRNWVLAGSLVVPLAGMICLYVWGQAFLRSPAPGRAVATKQESGPEVTRPALEG